MDGADLEYMWQSFVDVDFSCTTHIPTIKVPTSPQQTSAGKIDMSLLHAIPAAPSSTLLPIPPPLFTLPHFSSSLPAKPYLYSLTQSQRCIRCSTPQPAHDPDEGDVQVLMEMQSLYNHILVLDTPNSRLLLLDSSHNVHSMFNKGATKWTGSYWDVLATLPPVIPHGPIAIFGLGGGTIAHLMLELWPSLQLEGWEIDEILIHISRDYLGLGDLEKLTVDGGILNVHIGDVFSPDAAIPGGYAGIIVDLFAEGKVLPQLEQPSTWLEFYEKLKPDGRLMVNCGAGEKRLPGQNAIPQHGGLSQDDTWKQNATIRALCQAFPGQVNRKKMAPSAGENYLVLTGSLPDLATWSAALPNELKLSVSEWKICNIQNS